MYSPGKGTSIYGPAITVKMVETKSPGPTPSLHFADANKEGHIMYIQQPKGLPSACWGGLMSTRAQKLGSLGTIIDGRMRDTQEHIDMKYPVSLRIAADIRLATNRENRSLQEAPPSSDRTRSRVPRRSMCPYNSRAISGCIRTIS